MKVLVTGSNGQLGRDLFPILKQTFDAIGFSREQLDITSQEQVLSVVDSEKPDVIVHAAAYTAVDAAESDQDTAFTVNAYGTRNMALAAEKVGAKLCYISTDYVFDGTGTKPYNEYDNTNPMGVYGKSKRAGEQLVQTLCSRFFIVRTSWVYGKHGANFVKTMLKLGQERDKLSVVQDQTGSPTYTVDLSNFLRDLIQSESYGIYHASNTGGCSWFEFASEIFRQTGLPVKLTPCTTEDFPRPAPRPRYSVMDHMSIRTNGFKDLPQWQDALERFLEELGDSWEVDG
ncbi:dTDP-4-dehydrorhamnose reductase [Paenibacillus turpanensis]|uniref:dTDP-4-dehydrorhamnose reductase n=1 Tax=Paenibacillus turpanensis TaxID=2689078 RepID=UPI0014082701|nr:dTDP-4-dehydrorhamnose reductase [Paenibacillus turpanensis]